MRFLELAKNRYTAKKYDAEQKIPENMMQELKEILRLSPSSINSQPWKFVFIGDEELKSRLAAASYFNEDKINQASHLVVFSVLDSVEMFEQQIRQRLPEGSLYYYDTFIKPAPEAEIRSWMKHQVYLSLGFLLSAAAQMGLDTSPMEGIQTEQYKEILGLKAFQPLFAVALGYRHPEDKNQPIHTAKSRLDPVEVIEAY